MKTQLLSLKNSFEQELQENILSFWINEVYDAERKHFFGKIDNNMKKYADAPLSAVFITRIMWTFSASYRLFPKQEYKSIADEAFRIILENFWDKTNGGIYWSVYPDGRINDTKKQFYAQAFFIYALAEYNVAFNDSKAQQLAISMFMIVEKYAADNKFGGYIEANTEDWNLPEDQRLSDKDLNVDKSMNTHLHILEAYTNLYRVIGEPELKQKLEQLIRVFIDNIFDKKTGHLILFFDKNWSIRSKIDSYGHDIEASWLLCEAAEVIGNKQLIKEVQEVASQLTEATISQGLADNGGLWYEKENGKLLNEFHWWPQAEAVIGFFNAYQISGDNKYLELVKSNWNFIQTYIVDSENGEWFWGVNAQMNLMDEDKTGPWKAPYHNGRMCLEILRRIESMIQ